MKFKVLIADPDIKIRSILKKNFEENFAAEVFDFNNSIDAVNYLVGDSTISIIISKNYTDEDQLAHAFLNYLYDKESITPLIVIGEFEHTYKKYALVSSKLRVEEINRLTLKALNLKKEDFSFLKLPDYVAYPISYFYLMNLTPVELFIKLSKKGGEEYVKRFNENDTISQKDLSNYEALGLKEFYVTKENCTLLVNAILLQSLVELKSARPDEEKVEIVGRSFTLSSEMMRNIGITPETRALADQTILQIVNEVSKTDKLGIYLKKILDDSMSFSYRRSYLISLLCAAVLPKLDWVNGEQMHVLLHKLTMVSYFHDVYLDEDTLLQIMSVDEYKEFQENLSHKEKDLILNHANKAALLLQSYSKLPSGLDIIVKQHHGVTNGVGFAESHSAAISPMAIVFMVIEDFATQVLLSKKGNTIVDILAGMQMKYSMPSYRKIVIELASLNKKPT